MYQSRSLSRHHFVVADAAPLIYGGAREINYCFPQSLFCLYLAAAPSAASLFWKLMKCGKLGFSAGKCDAK